MAEQHPNDDLKARMREALERKQAGARAGQAQGSAREKVHGSEVAGGAAPKMHRRKAGGGGA
ncbi:MAG TPA: DUF5302 domain-containing protein [Marmoricola sp.]|nr:DUF5302 domain-containing protein [Marmoricola sp.]